MTVSPAVWMVYGTEEPDASGNTPELFLFVEKVRGKGLNYTVYANDDGSETLEIYTGDVRTQDEEGKLQDVDNSLEEITESGEKTYTNVNGFVEVVLPETLTAEGPVRIR